jgi:peptide methionine sulfoxide reductase MsrA
VYFGNGCFWGRQKDFVDTEMKLGRGASTATAVVGYAGGQVNQKSTCYYYNAPETQYERQGHAEVVQVFFYICACAQ